MGSSPTRLRLNGTDVERRCVTYKVCHDDYDHAHAAAEAMMLNGDVLPGCHMTPYECDRCGYWHVYNRKIFFDNIVFGRVQFE